MFVSARYDNDDNTWVAATDDRGREWHHGIDCQVGDWLTYLSSGGRIDAYIPPEIVPQTPGIQGFVSPVNVRLFGAKGDDSTDDAVAFQAAYNVVAGKGGCFLFIPAGHYRLSAFPTVSAENVIVQGEGNATTLYHTTAAGDFVVFSGNIQFSSIRDVHLSARVVKTSGYALKFSGTSFCSVKNVRISFCYDGLDVTDGGSFSADELHIYHLLGASGIRVRGTLAGGGLFGTTFSNVTTDQYYPTGLIRAWAPSRVFNVTESVLVNGAIYECVVAGTSAPSGIGPSGVPVAGDPWSVFNVATIIDGTVQWRFRSKQVNWFTMDSYAHSLRLRNCAFLHGYQGFVMSDTANTGSSFPKWVHSFANVECDLQYATAVNLAAGGGFHAVDGWFGSSRQGTGLIIGAGHKGDVSVVNSRINNNGAYGVELQAGPKNVLLHGNYVGDNSQLSAGTYHGIYVNSNATDFVITNNACKPLPSLGAANRQGYGILVNAGSSDRYVVRDNLVSGNFTGGVIDGGTGANKSVAANF